MRSISKHVGWNIRMAREQQRFTQAYVAAALNLSATGYRNIENGLTRISLERLFQIGEVLNTPVIYFLTEYPGFEETVNKTQAVSYSNKLSSNTPTIRDAQRLRELIGQLSLLLAQISPDEKKQL